MTENFVFPQFTRERDRIKFNTERYKNVSISQAFEIEYDCKFADLNQVVDTTPSKIEIGDTITTKIISISPRTGTPVFDNINIKDNIVCKNDMLKYNNFKFNNNTPLEMTIISKTPQGDYVGDIIKPIYDKWINEKMSNLQNQYKVKNYKPVTCYDLQHTEGGYMCKINVSPVEDFIGESYMIDAFIPGSQIVLNIETDFAKWNNQTVEAVITNYIKTNNGKMSIICSRKNHLRHLGNLNMVQLYKDWTENNGQWQAFNKTALQGRVTGVINSSKKCGVFVEIPSLSITGMVMSTPEEIVKYKPNQMVNVKISEFEENTFFNKEVGQLQHNAPYVINDDVLKQINIRPILKFA